MLRNTARAMLLTSASALTIAAFGAHAQTAIPGGGSSLAAVDYAGPLVSTSAIPTAPSEMFTFNTANASLQLQYFDASSGRGQTAFSEDNPAGFQYTGGTPLPSYVAFAASDAYLTGTSGETINGYTYETVSGIPGLTATYPLRASQDGALIQIPMLGIGIAIPAASGNSAVKTNGTLGLTDNDVCGIFSGLITDYGSISNPVSGLSGPITVYYRSDSSGTSFLFTNHLQAVCNSGNSNFPAAGLAAVPSTTFTNIFTGGSVPSNFVGESGSAGIAEHLAGTVTTSGGSKVAQAGDPTGIGYLSPDYTDISATGASNATAATSPYTGFINTKKLYASGIQGTTSSGTTAFLTPSTGNITLGLGNVGAGTTNPKPPAGSAAKNPLNWVPSIPVVTKGYPIIGYTDLELAQCYADPNVASGMRAFLTAHFGGTAAYKTTVTRNGFTIPAAGYPAAITKFFLTASSSLAIAAAGTAGTCASVSGR
jgi:ABC-type phosphate transport system substrate-binding protein